MRKTIKILGRRLVAGLRRLRDDERGAETSEIILALVVLVIGAIGAWHYLKERLISKTKQTADCIDNAATASSC